MMGKGIFSADKYSINDFRDDRTYKRPAYRLVAARSCRELAELKLRLVWWNLLLSLRSPCCPCTEVLRRAALVTFNFISPLHLLLLNLFSSLILFQSRLFFYTDRTSNSPFFEHLHMGNLIWHKYSRLISITSSVCELPACLEYHFASLIFVLS